MGRFNRRNATVRFEDANGLGVPVGPGPGDLTVDGWTAENTDAIRVLDRGVYDGHVLTDDLEQTCSVSIEQRDEALTSAVAARLLDFLLRRGTFANAVSTGPDQDVWTFKVIYTMTKGAVTSGFELPVCRANAAFAEAVEANAWTVSLTNNGAPVVF